MYTDLRAMIDFMTTFYVRFDLKHSEQEHDWVSNKLQINDGKEQSVL